jgi:hypothetical protein
MKSNKCFPYLEQKLMKFTKMTVFGISAITLFPDYSRVEFDQFITKFLRTFVGLSVS